MLFCTKSTPAFEDEPTLSDRLQRFDDLEDAFEIADFYGALFDDLDAADLDRLVHHENDSLATQAAWETVKSSFQIEVTGDVYRPKRQKLAWFLGFLEGRTRVTAPQWWREVILDARISRFGTDPSVPIHPGKPQASPYHPLPYGPPNCPVGATVTDVDGVVTYGQGEDSIILPEGLLRRSSNGSLADDISCCFTSERCFVAEHDVFGCPLDVSCIVRETNQVLWTSEACGCWWHSSTGRSTSWVTVVATEDDRVFVFGVSGIGFYVHGFRATDGETLFQFSSNY